MAINLIYMHNLRVEQCLKILTSRHGSAFRITGPLWGVDSPQIAEGPVIQTFDVFFVVGLSKLVNKQSGYRWFVTPWCSCDVTVLCKSIFMYSQNNSAHYFLDIPTRSLCGPVSIEFQFQECLVGQLQNPSWCLDVNTMYLKIMATLIILKHKCRYDMNGWHISLLDLSFSLYCSGDTKLYTIRAHMMTSSNGNIFRVTGPLCGEFTGPGEFPAQRPVTRGLDVFFDLRPE